MVEFEKTTKGNGLLQFPGGCVRMYDAHDDGIIFEPFALHAQLVDLNGDGFADIELTGTAVTCDETSGDEVGRCPVRALFLSEPAANRFIQSVSSPMIYATTEGPST